MLTLRRGWTRFFPLRCGSSTGGNLGYAARAINKLTPVAPPEDVMRPWKFHLHEIDIACTTAADGPKLPGNLWTLARECLAGPSTAQTQRLTDTQSALRRFPQHRTHGFASDVECKFLRGAKIPHTVYENTTRVGPRKNQLLRECAKNAQLGARAR